MHLGRLPVVHHPALKFFALAVEEGLFLGREPAAAEEPACPASRGLPEKSYLPPDRAGLRGLFSVWGRNAGSIFR